MTRPAILAFTALLPVPALAANQVALDNDVFVERVRTDAAGKQRILLEEPKTVLPGDRLVFVLNYRNGGTQPADVALRETTAPPTCSTQPCVRC